MDTLNVGIKRQNSHREIWLKYRSAAENLHCIYDEYL